MARFGDIASVWNTVRELNVGDIRDEADQLVAVAVVGDARVRGSIVDALRGTPGRFPAPSRDALIEFDLFLPRDRQNDLINTDLVVLVLDGQTPLLPEALNTADKLSMLQQPRIVAIVGGERIPRTADGRQPDLGGAQVVFLAQPFEEAIREQLLPALIEVVPDEQRVAWGRRLPGLRDTVAQALIGEASFSNATYALTSGLPEMIPLLNIPLNAADMVVLTKNQALLTYRLGLNYGGPLDSQAQMREILPVIGSAFVWRQLARQLIGLIPGFGLLPKVAVAYAGTYAVGQSASLWFSKGEVLSKGGLRQLYKRALEIGKQRARELLDRRKDEPQTGPTRRLDEPMPPVEPGIGGRIRRFFGRKRKPPTLPPST